VLILLIGAMTGTLLGELIAILLPEGVVKEFFLKSGTLAFGPGTLNVVVFSLTLGMTFKINAIGLIGLAFAVYLLKWVFN
jgi:hypothetical protein